MNSSLTIHHFFDKRTFTLTYAVYDSHTKDAVVIDPVLDYDPIGSKVFSESLEVLLNFLQKESLKVHYILETHAHADHISGSPFLKHFFPKAKISIGSQITDVQKVFKGVFDLTELPVDGSQFDKLIHDGETLDVGSFSVKAIHTPGHTPACMTYQIGNALFVGDAIFLPDYGTGRCDFPGGNSKDLYTSITKKIYAFPDDTEIYVGHDYMPNGRELQFRTTVGASKATNIQLPAARSEEEYVHFRSERDKTLDQPKLLFPSIYANIMGGGLPPKAPNGRHYFKSPINILDPKGLLKS